MENKEFIDDKMITFRMNMDDYNKYVKNIPDKSEFLRTLISNHFDIDGKGYVITEIGRKMSLYEYNKLLVDKQNKIIENNNTHVDTKLINILKENIIFMIKFFNKNRSKLDINNEEKEKVKQILQMVKTI